MVCTMDANSSGRPRRGGNGTCLPSESWTSGGMAASMGVLKMPGAMRTDADAEHRQLARDGQRHACDAGLGRRIGGLADLSFEGGHRRGVHDHAALTIGVGRIQLHDGRGGLVAQESADEVDVYDPGEEISGHRAVLAEHPAGADDARAVHQQVDAAHGGARGFHRAVHLGLGSDVALGEAAIGAERCRRRDSRTFLHI